MSHAKSAVNEWPHAKKLFLCHVTIYDKSKLLHGKSLPLPISRRPGEGSNCDIGKGTTALGATFIKLNIFDRDPSHQ